MVAYRCQDKNVRCDEVVESATSDLDIK